MTKPKDGVTYPAIMKIDYQGMESDLTEMLIKAKIERFNDNLDFDKVHRLYKEILDFRFCIRLRIKKCLNQKTA